MGYLEDLEKAKKASFVLKNVSFEKRNNALLKIANAIILHKDLILEANKQDLLNAKDLSLVMQKRLVLTEEKLLSIRDDILKVVSLDDPLNKILSNYKTENGLIINKVTVSFGVILAIYESRPNVSIDIVSLCIKTGNVCVLKGGKEAINSNKAIVSIIQNAIKDDLPDYSVILIDASDRQITLDLLKQKNYIDLVFPRGSQSLIQFVVENAKIPYIETGAGICHIFVDENIEFKKALSIVMNAKMSYPAVCNSLECLLVHEKVADTFLVELVKLFDHQVLIKGCEKTQKIINCEKATETDYDIEYNDLILNVKIVCDLNEAIKHIEKHSTHHSEAILSENKANQEKFLSEIDSACLYVNASTRFTDGGCFGFGVELGVSTQKLHARGPMGLNEMVTYKYKIYGNGQIR